MKKLLLTALACLGLGSFANAAPFVEGQAYRLKHNSSEFYFNMEIDGRGDNWGRSCASLVPKDQASVLYFVQNPDESTQWQIHVNSSEGPNLSSNSYWNSIINSSDNYYWTVNEFDGEDNIVVFTRTGTSTSSNNCLGPNVGAAANAAAIWTNQNGSEANKLNYCKWSVEPIVPCPITLSYTYDGKVYTLPLATVSSGDTYTPPTFDESVITLSGVPEGPVTAPVTITGTLKDGVKLFKLVSAAASNLWANAGETNFLLGTEANAEWLVYVPDGDNFKIYSLTNRKYVTPYGGGANNVTFTDNSADAATFKLWKKNDGSEGISLSSAADTGTSTFLNKRGDHIGAWSFDEGSSWFMVFDEEAYRTNIELFVQNGGDFKTAYENAVFRYNQFESVTDPSEDLTNAGTALKTAIDNATAARFGVKGVTIADIITALNTTSAAAQVLLVTDVTFTYPAYGTYAQNTITVRDVPFGTSYAEISAVPSVPSFFTATGISDDTKVVSPSKRAFTVTGTWSFPFNLDEVYRMDLRKSAQNNCTNFIYDFISNQIKTRQGTDADAFVGERLFYLKGNSMTDGELKVTLHSVALGDTKGIQISATNNAVGYMTNTPTVFTIKTNSNGTDGASLQHTDANGHINDISGTLGIWVNSTVSQNDGGSFIRFKSLIDADFDGLSTTDYDAEKIAAAKASKNSADIITLFNDQIQLTKATALGNQAINQSGLYTIGNKVGQYNGTTAEAITTASNAVAAAITAKDTDAISGATEALNSEIAKLSLNMPQAGKFYRLAGDSKYLTSTPSGTDRIAMVDKSNNGAASVVYVNEDGKLISLNNGLALGKFTIDGNRLFVNPEVDDAATVEFSSCPAIGKYYIKTGSDETKDYYIYNASDVVDRGEYDKGSTTGIDGNAGYRWNIEEVTWLPIPVGEKKHVTIYSPVTLKNDDNRFALHTLEVNGEFAEIIKTPLEDGAYIQPNTVYYGEVSTTEEPTNGCYYLEIAGTEQTAALAAEGTEEAETPATQIKGSFLATTKQEGTSYYTIDVKDNAAHFLAHTDNTYLPGFTAHVVSTAPSDAVTALGGYKLVTKDEATTSIREVEAAAQGADVVYDLSGRRVSKAVRGLYIINGKKVMVK